MEAIGEDPGKADDADSWLSALARLHPVPGEPVVQQSAVPDDEPARPSTIPQPAADHPGRDLFERDLLDGRGALDGPSALDRLSAQLAAAALAAPGVLATATYAEAADFAGGAEGLARSVEYLQLLAAGAVDRPRTQAISDGWFG